MTKYLVEWDTSNNFDSKAGTHAQGSAEVDAIEITSIPEVQYVTTSASANDIGGTFSLSYHGQMTDRLEYDISAAGMKSALMSLCTVTEVSVTREIVKYGYTWLVTFATMQYGGNLQGELVANSLGLIGSNAAVLVEAKQIVVGRLPYHYIITGLTSTNYYVRVSAYNGIGYGPDAISSPEFIQPSLQRPMPPRTVELTVASSSSITVTWLSPISTGAKLMSIVVEWDVINSNSKCRQGLPCTQSNCKDWALSL